MGQNQSKTLKQVGSKTTDLINGIIVQIDDILDLDLTIMKIRTEEKKMHKAIIFIGGVAVGSFVTWRLLKEKYIRQTQEEINEVREHYRKKKESEEVTVDSNGATETNEKPDLIAYAAKLTKNGYIDYTNPKSLVKATGDMIDAVVQKDNEESLDPVILNDPSYQPPYIISPEDFAIDDEYTIVNLNYYIDGVLTDEDDHIVENVDDVVGLENLNHMGEYEDDALHIRNENYKCEYEILLSRRLYHDTMEVN